MYLEEDITDFFNTHIEGGKYIDLNTLFDNFDFEFNTTATVFDLGMTLSQDKHTVLDINPESNAYKAGLRSGDQLYSRSYNTSDPNFEAVFIALRNDKETEFKYLPAKQLQLAQLKDTNSNSAKLPF